jgi:hypothetical protein
VTLDTFNRVFVLTIALLVAVTALALLLVTAGLVSPGAFAGGWIGEQLRQLDSLHGSSEILALALVAILAAASTTLAALELIAPGREVTTVDADGLRFAISREGISRVVQYVCEDVTGVDDVQPTVRSSGRGLEIDCVTTLQPRFNPIEVSQRLKARIESSVEAAIGVPVRQVTVHARPAPAPRSTLP